MRLLILTLTAIALTACSGFRSVPGPLTVGSTISSGAVIVGAPVTLSVPQTGMVGVSIDVSASSPATLMNPRWNFGDGSAVTTQTSHIYQQAGTYTIQLITDDASISAKQDIQIVAYSDVGSTCINQLALTIPASVIVGQTGTFAVNVPSCLTGLITDVVWEFDDGSTVTGSSVTHAFPALGNQSVDVTLTTSFGELHLGASFKIVSDLNVTPVNPRDPNDETTDPVTPVPPVTPVAAKGGWNPFGNSFCSGIAEYGGRVDCVSYAFCSGTSCGANDGAIATCRYTYYQGASDFRLNPSLWEWWSEDMDHPTKGWGCAVTGIDPHFHSAVFNWKWYLDHNADVKAAMAQWDLGADVAKRHWETYGMKEGRQGSAGFSAKAYLARYADLRAAYGANGYAAAIQHFVQYGRAEGRSGL